MDYREHYARARDGYARERPGSGARDSVYGLGVEVMEPARPGTRITFPADYAERIAALRAEIARGFESPERLFPAEPAPLSLGLRQPYQLPAVHELCDLLIPQLEANLFTSWVHVERVYASRHLVTDVEPRVSWLWHYDNHPHEVVKLLLYLDDVAAGEGAFEYLCGRDGKAAKALPGRTGPEHWGEGAWPGSRVPQDALAELYEQGFEARPATGPAGTVVLFDNNCIHRATRPRSRPRDALTLQLRPAARPLRPCVDLRWTGGEEHEDVARDPERIAPAPREAAPGPGQVERQLFRAFTLLAFSDVATEQECRALRELLVAFVEAFRDDAEVTLFVAVPSADCGATLRTVVESASADLMARTGRSDSACQIRIEAHGPGSPWRDLFWKVDGFVALPGADDALRLRTARDFGLPAASDWSVAALRGLRQAQPPITLRGPAVRVEEVASRVALFRGPYRAPGPFSERGLDAVVQRRELLGGDRVQFRRIPPPGFSRPLRQRFTAAHHRDLLLDSVLDVGCDEALLRQLVPGRYFGIDLQGDPDLRLDLERFDLPFRDRDFETVIGIEVLEHIENIHQVFDEMARVSRRNLIVSLPNGYWGARGASGRVLSHWGLLYERMADRHKWFFDVEEAEEFLLYRSARAGFRVSQAIYFIEDVEGVTSGPGGPLPEAELDARLRRDLASDDYAFANQVVNLLWVTLERDSSA